MSAIANQWTGSGVADDSALNSGNINTEGNSVGAGASWSYQASASPPAFYIGSGFRVDTETTSAIGRIDSILTSATPALRTQVQVTAPAHANGNQQFLMLRTGSATAASLVISNTGQVIASAATGGFITASTSPTTTAGDVLLIDTVVALHSAPSTSNGRIFFRVTNLTDETWNTTGEYFWDSGYTLNVGTATLSAARFGKVGTSSNCPNHRFEYLGIDGTTVSTSDTSQAAASAYFADDPTAVRLETPVPVVDSAVNPTNSDATDGSVTISWPVVAGAGSYEVATADGADATTGFVVNSANATSPYTITGLGAGARTHRIIANP